MGRGVAGSMDVPAGAVCGGWRCRTAGIAAGTGRAKEMNTTQKRRKEEGYIYNLFDKELRRIGK